MTTLLRASRQRNSNREADKNVRSGDYGKATQALLLLKVDAIISMLCPNI